MPRRLYDQGILRYGFHGLSYEYVMQELRTLEGVLANGRVTDAFKHVPRLRSQASDVIDMFNRKLYEHHAYIRQHFEDMPEIRNWHWTKNFVDPTAPPPPAKEQPRAQLFTNS